MSYILFVSIPMTKGPYVSKRENMTHEETEKGFVLALNFGKVQKLAACEQKLVPVTVQDSASAEDVARTVHAHPALSEVVGEAARDTVS